VKNESYNGHRPQRRWQEVSRDPAQRRAKNLKTHRIIVQRPESERVYTTVPAIVDEQTWADANAKLTDNIKGASRTPLRYTADEVLLSGRIVRCDGGRFGHAMTPIQRHPEGSGTWFYVCDGRHADSCGGVRIACAELDADVWAVAQALIRDEAYLRSRVEHTEQAAWSPEDRIAHNDSLIAKCDADADGISEELIALAGNPKLADQRKRLHAKAEQIADQRALYVAKRAEAEEEIARRAERDARLTAFIDQCCARADTLDTLTAEQRQRILLDMDVAVWVPRDRDAVAIVQFALSREAAAAAFDAPDEEEMRSILWEGQSGRTYDISASVYPRRPVADESAEAYSEGEMSLDDNRAAVLGSSHPPLPPSDGGASKLPGKSS
jgi:hypothetical protein